MAATPITSALLPNGMQQFADANGAPYTNGKLYFYTPGTTTLKDTWLDPAQSTLNSNPITLDAAGRAIIYGVGQYRQVLFDQFGAEIWDQLTQGGTAFNTNPVAVTAGATTDLGALGSNKAIINGGGSISSFGSSASVTNGTFLLVFNATTTLVNSANLNLPGGVNATVAAGSFAIAEYEGAGIWNVYLIANPSGQVLSWSGPDKSIVAAASTDIGSLGTNLVTITGSTTINGLGASANTNNPLYFVKFTGTPSLVNSASLALPGSANISVVAGNSMLAEYLGSGNWQVLAFWGGSGSSSGGVSVLADTNGSSVLFASNTTLSVGWTEVVAKTAIGGTPYLGVSFANTLNFGSTGANGLDTGAIAASTFYAIYAIYSPTSNTWATLASLNTAYAPTLPSGYTAMALLAIVPTTAGSQVVPGFAAMGNRCWFQPVLIDAAMAAHSTLTTKSVSAAVPPGAASVSGWMGGTASTAIAVEQFGAAGSSAGVGFEPMSTASSNGPDATYGTYSQFYFNDVPIITAQTIFVINEPVSKLYITGYTIGGATTSGGGGGGGGGGPVLIAKKDPAGATSVTFSFSGATYNSVEFHFNNFYQSGAGQQSLVMTINGDIGANYDWFQSIGDSVAGPTSAKGAADISIKAFNQIGTSATLGGKVMVNGCAAPGVSNPPYTGPKVTWNLSGQDGATGANWWIAGGGRYRLDGPVSSITFTCGGAAVMFGPISLWGWPNE